MVANEMMADINVFRAGVELVIVCESNGGLVVAIDGSRAEVVETEIGEKGSKPNGFFGGVSEG